MLNMVLAALLWPLAWFLEKVGIDAGILSKGPVGKFLRWVAEWLPG